MFILELERFSGKLPGANGLVVDWGRWISSSIWLRFGFDLRKLPGANAFVVGQGRRQLASNPPRSDSVLGVGKNACCVKSFVFLRSSWKPVSVHPFKEDN